jgi:hypothetical protein
MGPVAPRAALPVGTVTQITSPRWRDSITTRNVAMLGV